jgi:hypothetical protein
MPGMIERVRSRRALAHGVALLLILGLSCGESRAQGLPCFNPAWLQAGAAKALPASLVGTMTISGVGGGRDAYDNEYTVAVYVSRSVRLYQTGLTWTSKEALGGSVEMIEITTKNRDRTERITTDVPSRASPGDPTVLAVDFVNCRYSLLSDNHFNGVIQIETRRERKTEHRVFSWGPTKDADGSDASGFAIQLIQDAALGDPVRNGMKLQGSRSFVAPEINTAHSGIKVDWTVKWSFEPWSPGAEQRYAGGGLFPPPGGAAGSGGGASAGSSGGAAAQTVIPGCASTLPDFKPDRTYRLPGAVVTFAWPALRVTSIQAGSVIGAHDYYDHESIPVGTGLLTASGFPVDGSTVWVRVIYTEPKADQVKHCADIRYAAAAFADRVDTFPVGTRPLGLVFDGSRGLWVGNVGTRNLMKLDTRTGSVTLTVPVPGCPGQLAYDGTNVWTSTWCPGSKLSSTPLAAFRGTDGQPFRPDNGQLPILNHVEGLASIGPTLFAQYDDPQSYLACLPNAHPAQGARAASAPGVQSYFWVGWPFPREIVADGELLWSLSMPDEFHLIVLGTSRRDCTLVKQIPIAFNSFVYPHALAADARYIWIGMLGYSPLLRVDKSSGAMQQMGNALGELGGFAEDGAHLWFTDTGWGGALLRAIDPASGTELAAIPTGQGPMNVLYDGRYLWVANFDGPGTVTRILPHAPLLPPPVKAP